MEEHPTPGHGNRLPTDRYEAVLDSARALIDLRGVPYKRDDITALFPGAPSGEDELITEEIAKRTDLADAEKGIKPGEVTLVWYESSKVDELTEVIEEEQLLNLGRAKVLGHLAFARGDREDNAMIAGVIYFLNDRRILMQIQGEVKPEENLSEDSQACLSLLKEMGVRDFWDGLVFGKDVPGDDNSQPAEAAEERLELSSVEAFALEQFLNSYLPPDHSADRTRSYIIKQI